MLIGPKLVFYEDSQLTRSHSGIVAGLIPGRRRLVSIFVQNQGDMDLLEPWAEVIPDPSAPSLSGMVTNLPFPKVLKPGESFEITVLFTVSEEIEEGKSYRTSIRVTGGYGP